MAKSKSKSATKREKQIKSLLKFYIGLLKAQPKRIMGVKMTGDDSHVSLVSRGKKDSTTKLAALCAEAHFRFCFWYGSQRPVILMMAKQQHKRFRKLAWRQMLAGGTK